ncbi:MAG: TIM barrel protein [bacterium]|nr:TIM barrel protein [bacterium]
MLPVLSITDSPKPTVSTWSQALAVAVAAGFEALELPSDAPAEVISQATARGLRVAAFRSDAVGSGAYLADANPAGRQAAVDRVIDDIRLGAQHGGCVVSVAPAPTRSPAESPGMGGYAEAVHATLESLRTLVDPAARTGVSVGVEVPADRFLLSPAECRELFDQVNCPLIGACLDLPQAARVGWITDWIGALRHRIVCVRWGTRPAGDAAAAALAAVGYDGPVVFAGEPSHAAQHVTQVRAANCP